MQKLLLKLFVLTIIMLFFWNDGEIIILMVFLCVLENLHKSLGTPKFIFLTNRIIIVCCF